MNRGEDYCCCCCLNGGKTHERALEIIFQLERSLIFIRARFCPGRRKSYTRTCRVGGHSPPMLSISNPMDGSNSRLHV